MGRLSISYSLTQSSKIPFLSAPCNKTWIFFFHSSPLLYLCPMLKTILQFRLKQFFRLLQSVGWGLLIIALPLAFVMLMVILDLIQKYDPWISSSVICLLLISTHFNRKDGNWLDHLFKKPSKLFLIEYNALLLPLSLLVFTFFGIWKTPLLTHFGACLVSFFPIFNKRKARNAGQGLNSIPLEAFEIRTGIRRLFWMYLSIYLFGLAISKFVFGALAITILFGLFVTSFYDEMEPKEFIENIHFRTHLLNRKIIVHSLVFHILLSPHYLLFLIFHTQYWWLLLTAIIIAESFLLFAIVYKYAHYLPHQKKVYNSTSFSIYTLGFLVPFFLPASLYSLITQWRKAIKRIHYFYAKNQ
jgi:hypothetical protein